MINNTSTLSSPDTFFYRLNLFWITVVLCSYGVYTSVSGLTLRIEKILVFAAFLLFFAVFILRGWKLCYMRAEIFLAAWLAVSLISSILSINPAEALKHTLDLGLSVCIFFFGSVWRLEQVVLLESRPIMKAGFLLGAGSMLVALLYVTGLIGDFPWLSDFVQVERNISRIKMTMWEANLFGAVMMAFSLVSIAEYKSRSLWSLLCLIVCHAGLLLAYTRVSILGYFVGLWLYCHMLGYRKMRKVLSIVIVIGVSMVVLQLMKVGAGTVDENAYMRLSSLTPRLFALQQAFEDIKLSPIIGNGTYSIDFMHPGGAVVVGASEEAKGWISILPVAVLHDSGVIGFLLFQWFLIIVFRDGYRSVRLLAERNADDKVVRRMAAWIGAGIGMLILSITTSVYSLAAFWVVLAIIASMPKACSRLTPGSREGAETVRVDGEMVTSS